MSKEPCEVQPLNIHQLNPHLTHLAKEDVDEQETPGIAPGRLK